MARIKRFAPRLLPAVLGMLWLSACGEGQRGEPEPHPIRFYREYVRVSVSGDRTTVVGDYYFRNESDRPYDGSIAYPFPVDRHHGYPLRIGAKEERNGELTPIGFTRHDSSIAWKTSFVSREEKRVRIEYAQAIHKKHAVYIVTTTAEWGRPIEIAEFEFRIPRGFTGVELSFEPDRESARGETIVYYMKRNDFFPESDLTVTWD